MRKVSAVTVARAKGETPSSVDSEQDTAAEETGPTSLKVSAC